MSNWHGRYRLIIEQYRTALGEVSEVARNLVDAKMVELGHAWVCDDNVPDMDELLTAKEISERFALSAWDVHNWARQGNLKRYPFREAGMKEQVRFRVGDVIRYFALHRM